MSIQGAFLQHIALRVTNIEKSIRFYTDGLGFRKSTKYGGAPKIEIDNRSFIELFAKDKEDKTGNSPLWHLSIATEDCEKAVHIAEKAGAKVIKEPQLIDENSSEFPTRVIAFIQGPDSEVIEFVEERPV